MSSDGWWVVSFPDCIFCAHWKSSLGTRLEWRGGEVEVCDDDGEGRWGCVMMMGRGGGGGGGGCDDGIHMVW